LGIAKFLNTGRGGVEEYLAIRETGRRPEKARLGPLGVAVKMLNRVVG
jgi:hypothetical protein